MKADTNYKQTSTIGNKQTQIHKYTDTSNTHNNKQ